MDINKNLNGALSSEDILPDNSNKIEEKQEPETKEHSTDSSNADIPSNRGSPVISVESVRKEETEGLETASSDSALTGDSGESAYTEKPVCNGTSQSPPRETTNGTGSESEKDNPLLSPRESHDDCCAVPSKADLPDSKRDTMVQGNGTGHFARKKIGAENLAHYFAMPSVDNNVKVAFGSAVNNFKFPGLQIRKSEHSLLRDSLCENRNGACEFNSDDEEDVEIIDDNEEEDWSFDEDEGEVKPGKQCPCVFKQRSTPSPKAPLQRQNGNRDSPSTSRASPQHPSLFTPLSKALSCPVCEQTFDCRVDLNRHRLKHISEKSFKCSHCSKSFAFSFNLKSHERQHTGEKPYRCNKCGLSFVHAFSFHEHQRVHDARGHFVCSICLKWFGTESKYLLHIRKHSSIKPFKCNVCAKSFHRAAGLRAHELLHSVQKEDKLYKCQYCTRTFVRLAHKNMHESVHQREKLFPCIQCGENFPGLPQLKSHACSPSKPQQFWCALCQMVFPSHELLEAHSRKHATAAEKANSALPGPATKFNLFRRNQPITSTKRRFACQLCSQAFTSKRLLEEHGRIHQREYTPYMCKECCLTFTHASFLERHLAMHGDRKPALPEAEHCGGGVRTPVGSGSPLVLPKSRHSSGELSSSSASPSPLPTPPCIRIKEEPV